MLPDQEEPWPRIKPATCGVSDNTPTEEAPARAESSPFLNLILGLLQHSVGICLESWLVVIQKPCWVRDVSSIPWGVNTECSKERSKRETGRRKPRSGQESVLAGSPDSRGEGPRPDRALDRARRQVRSGVPKEMQVA